MQAQHTDRLTRARESLEGLSVGDAFGQRFFVPPESLVGRVGARWVPPPPWRFTDDTNMALSIFSILRQSREIDRDRLAKSFAERYDGRRGYGPAMHRLLPRILEGAPWKDAASSLFAGQGSFGNGSAMRVAPVGSYFADDLDAAAENARRSAEVTHAHPEAAAGAIAVAVAAGVAGQLRESDSIPTRQEFIDRVLPFVPPSAVHDGVARARKLLPDTPVRKAVSALGNGSRVTCQDTVPFVLWCAGERLDNYEEALWLTVSGGGDMDTTCAMVGGIVATYTGADGIPAAWLANREPLPDWPFEEQV